MLLEGRCKFAVGAALLCACLPYLFFDNHDIDILQSSLFENWSSLKYRFFDQAISALETCHRLSPRLGKALEAAFRVCIYGDDVTQNRRDLKDEIHLVVVACGDRLVESLVNIKSSLLFTKSKIFFHIFAEEKLQSGFKEGIEQWPLWYRKHFKYAIYPITYPEDGNAKNWKKLFKPCASQRLFLPLVLSDAIDSVIYVDTDILFLNDVTELWNLFKELNSTQLSSACIEHEDKRIGWYNRFARHPYYGTTGINSGVMLMNLTRMRKAMFKNDMTEAKMSWSDILLPLYNKYRYNITWGDQDLLNIIFHYNPEMLHLFSCDWNYRPDHCMYGQTCDAARNDGVKVMHGNRGVYHNQKQPAFKAVYEAIKVYDFNLNYTEYLVQPLERALLTTSSTYCGKESRAIIKGLERSLKKG